MRARAKSLKELLTLRPGGATKLRIRAVDHIMVQAAKTIPGAHWRADQIGARTWVVERVA